ncbi:MAG: hypothetical protein IIY49_12025 [Eubacterium sp.]|jgi:Mor family transcriptional regulator|nr:hypothetical protein [Eubacterium sp.]
MGYLKAEEVLPIELIELIQQYTDGTNIYIPRREKRCGWGEKNQTKMRLCERNASIYKAYLSGDKIMELSERFCLSEKSIWRIVGQEKKKEI